MSTPKSRKAQEKEKELRTKRKFERVILPPTEKRTRFLLDDDDDFEVPPIKERRSAASTSKRCQKNKEVDADEQTTMAYDETTVAADNTRKKRVSKRQKIEQVKQKLDAYPVMVARTTVKNLILVIQDLNEEQKKAVREMGFGSLLELRVDKIPTALAYWLVENFDAASCDLKLVDGRRLHIDEDDAYRVFGFPRGPRKVQKIKRTSKIEILKEWKSMLPGGTKGMVNAKDLKTETLRLTDADVWFKRNFIILVASSLIEATSNGYVFPFIMDCLVDMDTISEWNWCDYMMQSLVDSARAWQGDKKKQFCGPTLFLMMVYVDRVSIFNKKHCRKFPTVGNWDYKALKDHEFDEVENGGFGRGAPLEKIDIESAGIIPKVQDNVKEKEKEQGTSKIAEEKNARDFIQKMVQRTESVARDLVELYDMIPNASEDIVQNESFKKAHQAVQNVIGNLVEPVKPSPKRKGPQNLSDDDEIWNDEFIAEIEALELAARKKQEYVEYVKNMPSFSLGLTQEDHTVHEPVADFYYAEETVQEEEVTVTKMNQEDEGSKLIDATEENQDQNGNNEENQKQKENDGAVDENEKQDQDAQREKEKESIDATQETEKQDQDAQREKENKSIDAKQETEKQDQVLHGAPNEENENGKEVIDAAHQNEKNNQVVQDKKNEKGKKKVDEANKGYEEIFQVIKEVEINLESEDVEKEQDQEHVVKEERNVGKKIEKPHAMKCRSASKLKRTEVMGYPMNKSLLKLSYLRKCEEELTLYTWHPSTDEKYEMFTFEEIKLNRQLLKSMLHEAIIASDVVDAWSINMNYNEASRTSQTPKRFFGTTRIFNDIFLPRPKSLQGDAIMFQFVERLTAEVQKYSHHPVGDIKMFFFPIVKEHHFFLICVDLRTAKLYVLDHLNDRKSNCVEKKYGRVLKDVKEIFNFFLIDQHLNTKVEALSTRKYDILHIDWGDQNNNKDGAVYTMRHMETFMGEPIINWKAGLQGKLEKNLRMLRVKYCAAILSCKMNEKMDRIKKEAQFYYARQCEESDFCATKWLLMQ